jgi:virginiamycin B lyase
LVRLCPALDGGEHLTMVSCADHASSAIARIHRFTVALGACLAIMAVWASGASAFVYWANFNTNAIGRANLDGSGVDQDFIVTATSVEGVTVDSSYVYWSNFGFAASGSIGRANLDGSGVNQRFISGANYPSGVAVDSGHIYWANNGNSLIGQPGTIGRANLDGSGVDQSFITAGAYPAGVAVDGEYIYWTDQAGTIGRANLDGSGVDDSFITGASDPIGVAVDSGHIYWTNTTGPSTGSIGRANLDGSGVDQDFITGASSPVGVTVDSGHVYWSNAGSMTIGRANLDGSGVDQSFIAGADSPEGLVADVLGARDPTATTVNCSPDRVPVGQFTTCTATVTDSALSPTTPTGIVSFRSDGGGSSDSGAGAFSDSGSCTLSATAITGVASCSTHYEPGVNGWGANTITASYGGDQSHAASVERGTVDVICDCDRGAQQGRRQSGDDRRCRSGDPGAVQQPPHDHWLGELPAWLPSGGPVGRLEPDPDLQAGYPDARRS